MSGIRWQQTAHDGQFQVAAGCLVLDYQFQLAAGRLMVCPVSAGSRSPR